MPGSIADSPRRRDVRPSSICDCDSFVAESGHLSLDKVRVETTVVEADINLVSLGCWPISPSSASPSTTLSASRNAARNGPHADDSTNSVLAERTRRLITQARTRINGGVAFVAAVKWRTGAEGRISHLKRGLGWRRTRLRSHDGARIWCGHGVFTHNLTKLNKLRQ